MTRDYDTTRVLDACLHVWMAQDLEPFAIRQIADYLEDSDVHETFRRLGPLAKLGYLKRATDLSDMIDTPLEEVRLCISERAMEHVEELVRDAMAVSQEHEITLQPDEPLHVLLSFIESVRRGDVL